MDGLIDTCILIDILRAYPPAISWMQGNIHLALAVPSVVRMELVYGAQNKTERKKAIQLCEIYSLVYPVALDAEWALKQFEIYHLSHKVEIIDCFIAATSIRLRLPIYTRNLKDFKVLPGVTVQIPYT